MKVKVTRAAPFFAPSLLGLTAFFFAPLLFGARFVFWSPARGFLGLDVWNATLRNEMFLQGLSNTALLCAVGVPLLMGTALMASLMFYALRGRSEWMQSALFLPYVLPTAAVVIFFTWALDYRGIINHALHLLGIEPVMWLSDGALRISILALFLWKNVGFAVVFFCARLTTAPQAQIEAARLDGAGRARCVLHILLPHLAPTIVFAAVLGLVQAMDIFRESYLIAGNYPSPYAYTLQHFLYNRFHAGDYGSVVSASYFLLPITGTLVYALLKGEKYAQ